MEKKFADECTRFALVCGLYGWFASFVGNREWLVFHITQDFGFVKFTGDKALGIERRYKKVYLLVLALIR